MKVLAAKIGISVEELHNRVSSGQKWCYKCSTWKSVGDFALDKSRYDGYTATCRSCRNRRTTPGPGKVERQLMASQGKAWCRGCQAWIPTSEVRAGLCRPHTNEYMRNRYATSEEFRTSRRQKSQERRDNVAKIPEEVQPGILAEFGGLCAYCDNPATGFDHIIPVSRGGETVPGNVVPCCRSCNSSKQDRLPWEWCREKGITPKEAFFDRLALAHEQGTYFEPDDCG